MADPLESMEEIQARLLNFIETADLSGAVLPGAGALLGTVGRIGAGTRTPAAKLLQRVMERGLRRFRGPEAAKPVVGRVLPKERLALPDPRSLDIHEAVAGKIPYEEVVRRELLRVFREVLEGAAETKSIVRRVPRRSLPPARAQVHMTGAPAADIRTIGRLPGGG